MEACQFDISKGYTPRILPLVFSYEISYHLRHIREFLFSAVPLKPFRPVLIAIEISTRSSGHEGRRRLASHPF